MTKILIVSPFSGRKVGGGLATLNQQLTEAFSADSNNDVKLLTVKLPAHSTLDPAEHGKANIVYIEDKKADSLQLLSAHDDEREKLYTLLNEAVEQESISKLIGEGWIPEIIIGHSRFSGPAAVKLRNLWYKAARVEYFLHSFPVEGTLLSGDRKVADRKVAEEQAWMPQANVAVGVGPFLTAGAEQILSGVKDREARVHEFMPGTAVDPEPVSYLGVQPGRPRLELLMIGRASAPIKGLEDLLLAVTQLEDLDIDLHIRIRGYAKDQIEVARVQQFVDEIMVSVPHVVEPGGFERVPDGAFQRTHHHIDRVEVLELTESAQVLRADIRRSHAVLMPSYVEHFGLSPLEAAGHGVPILVTEMSGVGMFLKDQTRTAKNIGDAFVVQDLHDRFPRPLKVAEFLVNTPKDTYDQRPAKWSAAIRGLAENGALENRFGLAKQLHAQLKQYTWAHCAKALVDAANVKWDKTATVQGANGEVTQRM
jgi:glycosyltransferase involved in cell wall biosynthesis